MSVFAYISFEKQPVEKVLQTSTLCLKQKNLLNLSRKQIWFFDDTRARDGFHVR